jgi:uroporphyrinogen-III synthase
MMEINVRQDSPLNGVRVLITRAERQSKDLCDKLKQLGAQPIELPVIEICAPDSWQALDNALGNLDHYDWIILASANAVRSFVERLNLAEPSKKHCLDLGKPAIAVIGEATEKVARSLGLPVAFVPTSFIADTFIAEFPGYPHLQGLKFLWPRTDVGRSFIHDKLSKANCTIDVVPAYKTGLPKDLPNLGKQFHRLVEDGSLHAITVLSAQTAANLATIVDSAWAAGDTRQEPTANRIAVLLKDITVLSIGPQTSASARKHLGKVDLEADPHNTEGLIVSLLNHFSANRTSN